jgi:hypothetical protein
MSKLVTTHRREPRKRSPQLDAASQDAGIRRSATKTFALVSTSLVAIVAACSSTSSPPGITCGRGTTLADGQCVASDDSGPSDSSLSEEGPVQEAAVPQDASPDATESSAPDADGGDALSLDSSVEAGPSDPCPTTGAFWFDCDTQCNPRPGDHMACQQATCTGGGSLSSGSVNPQGTSTIRTPAAPGTDPKCATDCPALGLAYGISATLAPFNNTAYQVTVSPPWYLVSTSAPFCTTSMFPATTGCLSFDGTAPETIYIITSDPNAPARNVKMTPTIVPCP